MSEKESADIKIPEILSPCDDRIFKTLMTHPDAEPCLRDIIASNIGLPVNEVTVRNAELPISDVMEKEERFDVNCKIDGGDQAEVEMQASPLEGDSLATGHKNIRRRATHNVCDLHAGQKGRGVPYGDLVRTYQITFCGYTVFKGREDCFNHFTFRNKEGEELIDSVNVLFVELSKLKRVLKKPVNEMTGAEMWAVFLAFANKLDHKEVLNEIISAKGEIKVAYDLLASISKSEDERARYRARRKFLMDVEHNRIVSFQEGKAEGRTEGRTEGKLELARNLLAQGVPLEIIVKNSGLSLDEIRAPKR
jgi:predicted transposase/invertase (TIGR01784 family)